MIGAALAVPYCWPGSCAWATAESRSLEEAAADNCFGTAAAEIRRTLIGRELLKEAEH